ncbi:Hypothetical protein C900_05241 [Fulvivirga imtechensis AK7]|uniref:DNA topoisomerase n=1 Tax=Fulvivirga imtechensis AK7 TaxID=1237149 RepID=L8K164_9BACT|nr:DNA topoisomerase IB [Fulvivirga imtechensis]ELR73192.1 Hypothetical protein C900_05241 [Fulvivirga imtechensis AK7]
MTAPHDCPPNLVYISDEEPGYSRQKRGKGFIYLDHSGKRLQNSRIIERIKTLVIPPMWSNVWICPSENGHLQVTGYDQKGRKQYIYHQEWVLHRQRTKYGDLAHFGRALPLIRRRLEEHIKLRKWPKEKILAMVVMMLDQHYIRIGNKYYEQENHTYGLTTLRRKHLKEKNGRLYLDYKAKSGKYRHVRIQSKKLVRLIRQTSELPGYEIFRYLDEDNKSRRLDSQDVNQYLQEISGQYFTAKNFRTWGGTVLAIGYYEDVLREIKQNPRLKLETNLVRKVAEALGNTVATCREYYIHPKVLEVLMNDQLANYKKIKLKNIKYKNELSPNEQLALKIIENEKVETLADHMH